jgi:hypothetical protein
MVLEERGLLGEVGVVRDVRDADFLGDWSDEVLVGGVC